MSFDISAWFLGIFTKNLLDDSQAIIKCRYILYDLRKKLENAPIIVSHRSSDVDIRLLRTLKQILRELKMEQAGLFLRSKLLNRLIAKSLDRIDECERNSQVPHNAPNFVVIDILNVWGNFDLHFDAVKIRELEEFFYAGLCQRFVLKIKEFRIHWCAFFLNLLSHTPQTLS